VNLHIGIDDTDSIKGGCTTYIAALLVNRFSQLGIQFTDYPNIIRLNPNVPFKTRGNAAAALRIRIPDATYEFIRETVLRTVEENSRLGDEGTDPAVVFLRGHPTYTIKQFSREALTDIVPVQKAVKTLRGSNASAVSYGSGLGLVGALAALGQTLSSDHTFELVAYRERSNRGKPRLIDEDSVRRMDLMTAPKTFNNFDSDNRRVLITPHGPDPVLLGLRGESPEVVARAFRLLRIREPVERWVIFRTNHGTDAHFAGSTFNQRMTINRPIKLSGTVLDRPERISGGHIFFKLRQERRAVLCAAFEPTGKFKEVVAKLIPGDEVVVFGAVRKHEGKPLLTVNLEKIIVTRLCDEVTIENPTCSRCGKHMKSAGRGQGYRCERCKFVALNASRQFLKKRRTIRPGLYLPDRKAHRHLTKPLSRYGLEKRRWNMEPPSGIWHRP
jgi:tRNA(Ile2)-agmatinylcytidine synthase